MKKNIKEPYEGMGVALTDRQWEIVAWIKIRGNLQELPYLALPIPVDELTIKIMYSTGVFIKFIEDAMERYAKDEVAEVCRLTGLELIPMPEELKPFI